MYAAHMYFPVKTELTFSVIPEHTLISRVLGDKFTIVVTTMLFNSDVIVFESRLYSVLKCDAIVFNSRLYSVP